MPKGRPWKDDPGAKRKQLYANIRADIARQIHDAAVAHGRTLSMEIEAWFEELLTYRKIVGLRDEAHANLLRSAIKELGKTHPELFVDAT